MKIKAGFTLIELLVVISIISFLSSIVLANLSSARDRARYAAAKQFESTVVSSLSDETSVEYTFDSDSGADTSGNGKNGNLISYSAPLPSFVPGLDGLGKAVEFTGNQAVAIVSRLGPSSAPGFPVIYKSEYALSFWVKSTSGGCVYGERSQSGGSDFRLSSDGQKLNVFIGNRNGGLIYGTLYVNQDSNTPVFDGKWHYVLWADKNGAAKLYIDGIYEPVNFSYTRDASFITPNESYIGGVYSGSAFECVLGGDVDQFRVFDKIP